MLNERLLRELLAAPLNRSFDVVVVGGYSRVIIYCSENDSSFQLFNVRISPFVEGEKLLNYALCR